VCTDVPERLSESHGHGALGRSVEDHVLGESYSLGHLIGIKLEEWRLEEARNSWPALWINVKATGDEVKDQAKLILSGKHIYLGKGLHEPQPGLLVGDLLSWESRCLLIVIDIIAILLYLLGNALEVELLGVLLIEEAAVAHVLQALDEVLEVHCSLLLLQRSLDVQRATAAPGIFIRVKWVFEVDGEWVVEEVGLRRRNEWQVGGLHVMAVALLVPGSVYRVEALWLLAKEQAVHDHTEGPDIKRRGLVKEFEV
jgi:hypothetical protein